MSSARRTLILALLLVAAGSLIFTTGAAVIDDADTFAEDRLAVQPADGPNGNYAYLNDDDEIVVDVSASNPKLGPDFEGVNPDALASAEGVFTITYTADEYARVWIEHDGGDAVTFTSGGDSIESRENNVTLGPNQTVAVGLAIDTRGEVAGTRLGADEFSIRAEIAEPETVSSASSSTDDGGPITTVTAPSDDRREFAASDIDREDTIRFEADSMHLDGENVTLDRLDLEGVRTDTVEMDATGRPEPFENGSALDAPTTPRSIAYLDVEHDFDADEVDAMTVRFSADPTHLNATGTAPEDVTLYRQTETGEWEEKPVEIVDDDVVRIMGLPEDRVHFRATTEEFSTFAVAAHAPRFDATAATVAPEAIDPGEAVTVRATVENGGGAAGKETVTLTADGEPVANETVALAPTETGTVALSATFGTAGEYDLAVAGTDAGTLLVGYPADDDGDADGRDTRDATGGESPDRTGGGPTAEPAGIDLVEVGSLLALVAFVVLGIAIVRRMPRS